MNQGPEIHENHIGVIGSACLIRMSVLDSGFLGTLVTYKILSVRLVPEAVAASSKLMLMM